MLQSEDSGKLTHAVLGGVNTGDHIRDAEVLRTSELQHRLISQIIPAFSFAYQVGLDRSVKLDWITPGVVGVIGYSEAELKGEVSFRSRIHPADRATHKAALEKIMDGNPVTMEFRFLTKSGEQRWLQCYNRAESSPAENRVIRIVGATQDITDRKRAEEELRKESERLKLALDVARLGKWEWEFSTDKVKSSPRLIAMFCGATENDISEETEFRKFIHPEDVPRVDEAIQAAVNGENHYHAVFRVIWLDGSLHWLEGRGSVFRDDSGQALRMVGVTADITERKKTEKIIQTHALLANKLNKAETVQEASRLIVEAAEELIGWDAAVMIMFDANTGLCRSVLNIDVMNGLKRNVLSAFNDKLPSLRMRKTIEQGAELILRNDPEELTEGLTTFGNIARRSASLMYVPVRDGKTTVGMLSIQSYKSDAYTQADLETLEALGDQCAGALARIRSGEIQRESQERLYASIENTPNVCVQWFDGDGRVLYWNPASESVFGWKSAEAIGKTLDQLILDSDSAKLFLAQLNKIKATGKAIGPAEFKFKRRNGNAGVCLSTCFAIPAPGGGWQFVCMDVDITERKESEVENARILSLLQATVESSADGLLVVDLNNRVTLYNQRFAELWRVPKELLALKDDAALLNFVPTQLADPDAFIAGVRKLYSQPEAESVDSLLFKDGRIFERHSRPQKIGDEIVGRVWNFKDVTERNMAEESARQSQQQFANLVNNVDGIVWEAEAQTFEMTFVSFQAERILGYPVKDWHESKTFWQDHIHPDDREEAVNYCRAQTQLGESQDFEYRMIGADGRVVWIRDLVMVNMKDGKPVGMRGIMVDVTKRKQAEQSMRASEAHYKLLFESAPDAVFLIEADGRDSGRILAANPTAAEMHGYTISELLALNIADLDGPDVVSHKEKRERLINTGESLSFEIEHRRKDGTLFPVDVRAEMMLLEDRKCILAFDRDITERKRAERRAEEATIRLQVISQRLIDLQETERRHLARELHDEVGQTLTATKIILESLNQQVARVPLEGTSHVANVTNADSLLTNATQHVDHLLEQIRNLSLNLRPPMLDDFGLVSAMRWLLDKHAQTTERTVEFDADYHVENPDHTIETACFRIAQEAITNITRYSKAGKVSVTLRTRPDGIKLVVSDDGVGFDVVTAGQKARKGGSLGLLNMQERAGLVGGQLDVISTPGKGTTISARFPLASQPTPAPS